MFHTDKAWLISYIKAVVYLCPPINWKPTFEIFNFNRILVNIMMLTIFLKNEVKFQLHQYRIQLHPMCQHFFLFLPFFWSFSWFYWYRNRWQFPSLLSSSERKDVKKSIEIMKNEHSEYKITYSRIDFTWNRLTLTINDRNTIFL